MFKKLIFLLVLTSFSSEIYGLPSISKVKSCKFGIKAAVSTGNSSLSGDLLQEVPCPMSDFCVVEELIDETKKDAKINGKSYRCGLPMDKCGENDRLTCCNTDNCNKVSNSISFMKSNMILLACTIIFLQFAL